jgi:hypothetical protein
MTDESDPSPSVGDQVEMRGHVGTVTALEDQDGRAGVRIHFAEADGSEWFPLALLQETEEPAPLLQTPEETAGPAPA